MGAQENKQVVRALYAAFGRGDITALLALVAEDMVWRMPGMVPHYSGTYRGPSGVAGFFRELNANVRIESFEPREFVAEADCVLVTGWSSGRVKSTGRMVDNRWAMAFNSRRYEIRRVRRHPSFGQRPRKRRSGREVNERVVGSVYHEMPAVNTRRFLDC